MIFSGCLSRGWWAWPSYCASAAHEKQTARRPVNLGEGGCPQIRDHVPDLADQWSGVFIAAQHVQVGYALEAIRKLILL